MAQHRKASDEVVRESLKVAIRKAAKERREAIALHAETGRLADLRSVQVATDTLARLNAELRQHETQHSIDAVRFADSNPKRAKHRWPVGKPDEPPRPKKFHDKPEKERPPLPPPVARPRVLVDHTVGKKVGPSVVMEHVSWWVGKDRTQLSAASEMLAKLPPSKTASPLSKKSLQKAQQKQNEAKRQAAGDAAAKRLQEKLQPMAGAFNVIPQAR